MGYTIAAAAKAALTQATQLYPKRSKASDGLVGDPAHASRRSWHNPSRPDGTPDPDGVVYAFDLTHDPEHGCDAHALVRAAVARKDRRVMEAISQGKIWTKARAAEGWRTYDGSNAHTKHAHVTVDPRFAGDTAPWWKPAAKPAVKPPPPKFPLPADHWFGVESNDPHNHSGLNHPDAEAIVKIARKLGVTTSGRYTPAVERKVIAFQKAKGLQVDGKVGRVTWGALFR